MAIDRQSVKLRFHLAQFAKVMFSQVSVCLSTGGLRGGGGACVVGSMCGREGVHGGGVMGGICRGMCVVGGMRGGEVQGVCGRGACVAGGHAWQERRPLQRVVRILLECILVCSNVQ